MVADNIWTNIDSKETKIIALNMHLYKLEKSKGSAQKSSAIFNNPMYCELPNKTEKYSNMRYMEGLENLESWSIKDKKKNKPKHEYMYKHKA